MKRLLLACLLTLAACAAARAQTKISELPAGTPSATDVVPFVADPAGTPATKKTTVSNLLGVQHNHSGGDITAGTVGAARLPSTSVNAVANDANVQGSISAQTLTLSWSGALAKSRQHGSTAYTDQANTFGAFLQKFRAGSNFQFGDPADFTKLAQFDLSNIATGTTRTVNLPDADSTTAQPKAAVSNQFLTAMSAQGVFTSARPTWADIDRTTSSLADISTRSASDLSSGTLPDGRFPATLPAASGVNLTALNASNLGSGTVPTARLGSGAASSAAYLRGDQTWAAPVTSIAGTANQVTASAATGAVTLSLPQSIHAAATPQFAKIGVGAAADASAHLLVQAAAVPQVKSVWTDNTSLGVLAFYENSTQQSAWQQIGSNFATPARRGAMEFANLTAAGVISFWTNSTQQMTLDSAGRVGVGTSTIASGQKLEVNGGLALNTATAKPTCTSTTRGTFWVTQGASGVKDSVEVCAKDAADAYAWRTLY